MNFLPKNFLDFVEKSYGTFPWGPPRAPPAPTLPGATGPQGRLTCTLPRWGGLSGRLWLALAGFGWLALAGFGWLAFRISAGLPESRSGLDLARLRSDFAFGFHLPGF